MPDRLSVEDERAPGSMKGKDTIPPGDPGMAPPAGSPETSEKKPLGEIEQAKSNVQIALTILENSLPIFGGDSDEGKAVHAALGTLYKKFAGKKSAELVPAQLMQMVSGMPDQYKQQAGLGPAPEPPAGMTPGGVINGPHVPANINP